MNDQNFFSKADSPHDVSGNTNTTSRTTDKEYHYVKVPIAVLEDQKLLDAEKIVYAAMLHFSTMKYGACPSIGGIAKLVGKSESSARRAIHKLIECGYIEDHQHPGKCSKYEVIPLSRMGGVSQMKPLSRMEGDPCHGWEGYPCHGWNPNKNEFNKNEYNENDNTPITPPTGDDEKKSQPKANSDITSPDDELFLMFGYDKIDNEDHSDTGKTTEEQNHSNIEQRLKRRINTLFHRRDSTSWSNKETKLLKAIAKRDGVLEEMTAIEALYNSGYLYRRRDVYTFLNNFATEFDRAQNQQQQNGRGRPGSEGSYGRYIPHNG